MMKKRDSLLRSAMLCGLALGIAAAAGCGLQDEAIVLMATETAGAVAAGTQEELYTDTEGSLGETMPPQPLIYVYVCGAVMQPGVVELAEGSRAAEALEAAGGFAPQAQTDYVNLAAKVADGEKLYFPEEGEAELLRDREEAQASGLVNINTADAQQLCTLPGIGASRAQDIIRYREQNGEFECPEDIMKVSGIKENAYARLKDRITVK